MTVRTTAKHELIGPLKRTERFLAVRLMHLERQLPVNGSDPPDPALWREYVDTAKTYAHVRELIYGRRPT